MKDLSLKEILKGILNSYSQIFYSESILFAFALVLISFFDLFAGFCGLLSVVISNLFAIYFGFDRYKVEKGLYGFNSLLVGLGIGIYFDIGIPVLIILFVAALMTFFLSAVMEGVIGKYALPFLSVPFLISIWIITLATRDFEALGVSHRGIYTLNDLYTIGGSGLVDMYQWWNNLAIPKPLKIYFTSLGAIFFQYNMLSGVIIAAGLLYYSRIAFSLSLIGFLTAYYFYQLIGADISELSYHYIGFNYILTSIALGGYFLIPSKMSYLWTILIIPVVAVITISTSAVMMIFQLSIYSLPFNMVVLMFLYVLKLRTYKTKDLSEVVVQHGSPEKNLYMYSNFLKRFSKKTKMSFRLPFWGSWTISQGHDGEITHKEDWKYAWDFIIEDSEGKTYNGSGVNKKDFYCYSKAVLAPAAGYIAEIDDSVEDNEIGDINLKQNWGNTIVIKHDEYLYTKMSHLKPRSIKVVKGEYVKQGQLLALCGNTGRSPEPHLHFQFQTTPYIGSKTLEMPLSAYIQDTEEGYELKTFEVPNEKDVILNIDSNSLLKNAFYFIPGRKIEFEVQKEDITNNEKWEIYTNALNQSYIYCEKTNSLAYFERDDYLMYFTGFKGGKESLLYYFYLAFYKIQTGFYKGLKIKDTFPINMLFASSRTFFQDFTAPFHIHLKATYEMEYISMDDDMNPEKIELQSKVTKTYSANKQDEILFNTVIGKRGICEFIIKDKDTNIIAKCIS